MGINKKILFQKRYGNDLSNSLFAGYSFENDILDITGNHNGISFPIPVYPTGIHNLSADFGTVTDANYISVPNSTDFTFLNSQGFTVSAWVYFDAFSSNSNIICGKRDNNSLSEWQFGWSSTNNGWQYNKFSGGTNVNFRRYVYATTTPTLSTWYHICLTDDGSGNVYIYINGTQHAPTLSTTGTFVEMTNTASNFTIGSVGVSAVLKHKGRLDELYLFNRAITPTEVTQLSANATNSYYPFT